MIIKLIGYGFKDYFKDNFNKFDALIVCLSIIEISLSISQSTSHGSTLTAFRAIRILRIFKLSRQWKAFNLMITKISASL